MTRTITSHCGKCLWGIIGDVHNVTLIMSVVQSSYLLTNHNSRFHGIAIKKNSRRFYRRHPFVLNVLVTARFNLVSCRTRFNILREVECKLMLTPPLIRWTYVTLYLYVDRNSFQFTSTIAARIYTLPPTLIANTFEIFFLFLTLT